MKRLLFVLVAAACVAAPSVAAATLPATGQWSIASRRIEDPTRVQLRLEYSHADATGVSNGSWSFPVPLADIGLTPDRLRAPIAPYAFKLVRDAGTFDCSGTAGDGGGAGQYTFAVTPAFGDALASRGIARPTFDQSLTLALAATTTALVDQLSKGGSRPSMDQLVRLAQHGVGPQYVADLAAVGYRIDNADALVRMRDRGISADYVRALQSAGYTKLSPDEIVRLADHGVTSRFIDDLAKHGYSHLAADDLIRLRDHGVTVAFIDRLQSHGYKSIPVGDLVRLRDSGF